MTEQAKCQCDTSGVWKYAQRWTVHLSPNAKHALTCDGCGLPANDEGWRGLIETVKSIPECAGIYKGYGPDGE